MGGGVKMSLGAYVLGRTGLKHFGVRTEQTPTEMLESKSEVE